MHPLKNNTFNINVKKKFEFFLKKKKKKKKKKNLKKIFKNFFLKKKPFKNICFWFFLMGKL